MTISIGSDHAGFRYKGIISRILSGRGIDVIDRGTDNEESVDYPDFAVAVAHDVAGGGATFGILVCGSGIGVAITADKVAKIRAANCVTPEMARLAREHNSANVLAIGERIVAEEDIEPIVDAFLSTDPSSHERHRRRIEKIHDLTGC
jgi:ribose 5-phosphate isomerase B